jgi:antirestriction protein
MTRPTRPAVYTACLSCYNAGIMIGEWIPATDTLSIAAWREDHQERYSNALEAHEEFAIHDYDDMVDLGEHPSLEEVQAWAKLVERYGLGPVDAYHELGYEDPEKFRDHFIGIFESEEDYARSFIEDTGLLAGVSDSVKNYFDYEAYTRDLFMDLDSAYLSYNETAVFDPNA